DRATGRYATIVHTLQHILQPTYWNRRLTPISVDCRVCARPPRHPHRSPAMADSFSTRDRLEVNGRSYTYASLTRLGRQFDLARLPYSMKILLENLLRHEDGGITVGKEHIEAVARWDAKAEPDTEIAFMPARVVLQDFTGVPCVVDLAAMRDAVARLGGRPEQINPLIPSELVID